jgi:hypothetical protein
VLFRSVLDIVVLGRVGLRAHVARARMAIFNVVGGDLRKRYEVEWGEPVGFTHGYGLALGDLDGDGKPEVVSGGFLFDGTREQGFVRVWSVQAGGPVVRDQLLLGGKGVAAMRVNDLAIGDIDGDGTPEVVVAGRRGAVKREGERQLLPNRREQGDLTVLRFAAGKLSTVTHTSWARATSLRLRSVVVADLDGDQRAEIVAGGQYDADGKAALGLFRWNGKKLGLVADASSCTEGVRGEIKDLVVVGRGAEARVVATGVMGGEPERQGTIGAWHLAKDRLMPDGSMVTQNADETRARSVVVVPGVDGSSVLTIGHARNQTAMIGQVLRWPTLTP